MLVDIGEGIRTYVIEADQIETVEDYGTRHGCEIVMISGRRVQHTGSARSVQAKIEQARMLAGQQAAARSGRA